MRPDVSVFTLVVFTNTSTSQSYLSSNNFSAHTAHFSVYTHSLQFLVPLRHHRGFQRNARRKKSAMALVVVEGMPETAVGGGGGVMLNRRRSKARRRKRKELFAVQMCFAGVVLGLVTGLQSVAQKAGEGQLKRLFLSLSANRNHMFLPGRRHRSCGVCGRQEQQAQKAVRETSCHGSF